MKQIVDNGLKSTPNLATWGWYETKLNSVFPPIDSILSEYKYSLA